MISCNLIGCTSGRLFTISWPAGQKSYFSDNFLVYKGLFKFLKQLNDNVKVKMFSDDSFHSESEFYYPDELNFLENEPVSTILRMSTTAEKLHATLKNK